jgi:hypothetical protein
VKKSKTLSDILEFSVVAFIVFILMMMLLWGCKEELAFSSITKGYENNLLK